MLGKKRNKKVNEGKNPQIVMKDISDLQCPKIRMCKNNSQGTLAKS